MPKILGRPNPAKSAVTRALDLRRRTSRHEGFRISGK
jgi:hypothetical protein